MSRRPPGRGFLSGALVLGGLVLLTAIVIGNQLGDRVLTQVATRTQAGPILPTPVPASSQSAPPPDWKKIQVTSVATDPHFPDPRVTPPTPRPTPTAKPTPTPKPKASPSASAPPPQQTPYPAYTPPPLGPTEGVTP